jgi:hypothetical protein
MDEPNTHGSECLSEEQRFMRDIAAPVSATVALVTDSGNPASKKPDRWKVLSENNRNKVQPGTELATEASSVKNWPSLPSCTFAKQAIALFISGGRAPAIQFRGQIENNKENALC